MALVPRGYGGFPPVQFGLSNQRNYRNYNSGYDRRQAAFAPRYLAQPFYQPPFDSNGGYPLTGYDQMKRPGLGAQFANLFYQLDDQYRYEQYLRNQEKMQRNSWRQPAYTMPLPMYTAPLAPYAPYAPNYHAGTVYNYEKETEYIPYPIYIGPPGAGNNFPQNLGYTTSSNLNFGIGGGANLLPKVRVIFIPTGNASLQQSYTGPLTMPPFLFNRMSQPMCSFPVPPPLPQLGSLPLSPAIQQMVMQRYSNPVAVLPFSSNWQMPQQMMFNCPQALQQQQQQQYQQPMMPMSGFQSLPPAPPSYIPPPPMQACQSLPPAPQSYIPPPMSAYQSLPPAPQSYIPPTMPPFQSFPPVPQSYIPPPMPNFQSFQPAQQPYSSLPPTIPDNLTMLPPPPLQAPDAYASPFVPQYLNSSYPSLCRACPPAPPPLSIPVTGHCWVQHCAACHHVPIPVSNSNARPSGGRITPLLRHPTVPQYVPNQTIQQQQYPHANAPVMMRPWLRKTPPLPLGAIVISDQYISRRDSYPQHHSSRRQHRHHQRRSGPKKRSTTVTPTTTTTTTTTTPASKRNNRSVSPKGKNSKNNNNNNTIRHQGPIKSKSTSSSSSSSTSSSGTSVEYQKLTLNPSKPKKNSIPPQLASEARNINLQYNYQSQEIPSVYLLNRYLKSSSEASTLSSNHEKSSDSFSPYVKKLSPLSSPSIDLHSIKEESSSDKENEKSSRSPIEKPKEKFIIIRELIIRSPSTISTISSNMTFSIIDNDSDSISTTSTIKAAKLE